MVTIDIYSDVICPWCFVGKRRMEKGLAGQAAAVRWHPFELNPDMPREGVERRAYRVRKFGSWERSLELDAQVGRAFFRRRPRVHAWKSSGSRGRPAGRRGAVCGSGNRVVASTTLIVPGVVFPEPCRVAERAIPACQTRGCVSQIR